VTPSITPAPPLKWLGRTLLGAYFLVLPLALIYVVYKLWPRTGQPTTETKTTLFGFLHLNVDLEMRLILLVATVGALGSFIHAATSFADFVGNRRASSSWNWWYILRPFIGSVLATIFYFVIRGGLLSAGATGQDVSTFGITAVAGLVGMFAKQATDKLAELFDDLFKTDKPEARGDKLTNPAPVITGIEPPKMKVGSGQISLDVHGRDFVQKSEVRINGTNRVTTFVNSTKLVATLIPSDLTAPSELQVTVFNPPPGGGLSEVTVVIVDQA
jgi:hypothetical protein